MFAVTTPTIEGHPIQQYFGLVSGESIHGVNAVKDFSAGLTNFFGGRSSAYEEEIQGAYTEAVNEMLARATQLGANAVVGVKVDYFSLGSGAMLAAIATGTAVRI